MHQCDLSWNPVYDSILLIYQKLKDLSFDEALREQFRMLEEVCSQGAPNWVLHLAKDALSWGMLDARLRSVPMGTLQRAAQRIQRLSQHPHMSNDEHARARAIYTALQERGDV